VLNRWLAVFHVTPRRDLAAVLDAVAAEAGASARTDALHRGYAVLATARRAA
jgi:S-adenosylmethionine-diacylgycerolhomoserine-N-methlytransferase